MSTRTWPDSLPFAKLRYFGCPYHGRVQRDEFGNGSLTLPNARTIAYTLPDGGGQNVMVRGSLADVPTRTAQEQALDTAQGYEWRDYGLLSGTQRQICGQELGEDHWLYSDANATWVVRVEFDTPTTLENRLRVYLVSLFGYFSLDDLDRSMTERLLASYTWTPVNVYGVDQGAAVAALGRELLMTHKADGSVTMINVCTKQTNKGYVTTNFNTLTMDRTGLDSYFYYGFSDAIKVTITGNGSLMSGTIGNAIAATINHHAAATDMWTDYSYATTADACGGEEHPTEATYSSGLFRALYVVSPSGDISYYEVSNSYTFTATYDNLDCETGGYDARNYTRLHSYNASFSGESWFLEYQEDGITDLFGNFTYLRKFVTASSPTVTGDYVISEGTNPGVNCNLQWLVAPNVCSFNIRFGESNQWALISAGGDTLFFDANEHADPPAPDTVTHNPGSGDFYYETEDGVKAGCYV